MQILIQDYQGYKFIKTSLNTILTFAVMLFFVVGYSWGSSSHNNATAIVGERSAKVVAKEAKITGLYVAYFNRAADQEGLKYWTDKADEVAQAGGDASSVFKKLSGGFATHPTFKSTYDHLNNEEFVSLIYRNALGRAGDAEGIAYWTKKLDVEGMIRSDMVSDFVELSLETDLTPGNYPNLSAEELAGGQLRQDLITNKVTAALAFTHQLGVLSNVEDSQDPEDDPAYLASIEIISEVTEDATTVSSVLAFLESIKGSEHQISQILGIRTANSPLILSLVTELGNTKLEGVLSANRTSTLRLSGLKASSVKITLNTNNGIQELSSVSVSTEKQTITFTSPVNITEGELSIVGNNILSIIPYSVVTAQTPYLAGITLDSVKIGDTVTLTGGNLPTIPVEVVFGGQDSSLTQTVTPSNNSVSFTVPQGAASGRVYLQISQIRTNSLYLSVKREIEVQVALGEDVTFDPSDISFILGLEKHTLDQNYTTTLGVENEDMQYLHAAVSLTEETSSLLYSAVVLPDMTGTVTINAQSTAVAWIFMGIGASVTTQKDELRSLYDHVSANTKVEEFAVYIDTLQKNDFGAWATLSDETLQTKYQDALKSVLETPRVAKANRVSMKAAEGDALVKITQDPENGNIYVDDNIYKVQYNTGEKLNNGSVNILNDTRLFLSVEIRDLENGKIVNGYRHPPVLDNKVIAPKGWVGFGFSSLTNLKLSGTDSNIEIIIGAHHGDTDKNVVADGLRTRVWLEGVAAPALNIILSTILDARIERHYGEDRYPLGRRMVSAISNIYGAPIWVSLSGKIAEGQSWTVLYKHFIEDPIKNGIADCFVNGPQSGVCENTAKGLLELVTGEGNVEEVGNRLIKKIANAVGKNFAKDALVAVPVIGWVSRAALAVYDKLGTISNIATIEESLLDMEHYPREINVNVEFALKISSVTPMCVGIVPSTASVPFAIEGEGFEADDGTHPSVISC